jgi:predicted nucleic acid-binding protein
LSRVETIPFRPSRNANDAHHATATAALARAQRNGDRLAMAASAFAECVVGPARRSDRAVEVVGQLFERLPIDVIDLDLHAARTAATLRARHNGLRLADALVIATAAQLGADELITTDHEWPSTHALKLDLAITFL